MSDYVFYLLCDIKCIVIAVCIDLSIVCIGLNYKLHALAFLFEVIQTISAVTYVFTRKYS